MCGFFFCSSCHKTLQHFFWPEQENLITLHQFWQTRNLDELLHMQTPAWIQNKTIESVLRSRWKMRDDQLCGGCPKCMGWIAFSRRSCPEPGVFPNNMPLLLGFQVSLSKTTGIICFYIYFVCVCYCLFLACFDEPVQDFLQLMLFNCAL